MTHGAIETAHVSAPPTTPVPWKAWKRGTSENVTVRAQFWAEARIIAARLLKCDAVDVECTAEGSE